MTRNCQTCEKEFEREDWVECHCVCCWAENCFHCNCDECCDRENERLRLLK